MVINGKLLRFKIVAAAIGAACSVVMAICAFAKTAGVNLKIYEPSSCCEILLYVIAAACFINYLLVCLKRRNDFVSISNGMFEVEVHRNLFLPLSKKHISIDISQIREFDTTAIDFLTLIPYGTMLRVCLPDGKWKKLPAVPVNKKQLDTLFMDNGISKYKAPEEKKSKSSKIALDLLIYFVVAAAALTVWGLYRIYSNITFMPENIWIPFIIIGMFLGMSLRDIFRIALFRSCILGVALGALLYASAFTVNYKMADMSGVVMTEYKVGDCYSEHHKARKSRRYRTSAFTEYYVTLLSVEDSKQLRVLKVEENLYRKIADAETVTVPTTRGALGWPVCDKENMEIK